MKNKFRLVCTLIVAQMSLACWAQQDNLPAAADSNTLRFQFSPFTLHYSPSDDHKPVWMVGLERETPQGKLDGFTYFSNSFGQPSAFIYPWGQNYRDFLGVNRLSWKWTAGLLYGYKEPYENKVPLNYKGFSPGAILAVAYEFKSGWSAQLDMLGTSALMFQFNMPIK